MGVVRVRYLLWLADKIGVASEEYGVEECISLKRLMEMAAERHSYLARVLPKLFEPDSQLIVLVNGRRGWPDTTVCRGDIVTVTPVVSGG